MFSVTLFISAIVGGCIYFILSTIVTKLLKLYFNLKPVSSAEGRNNVASVRAAVHDVVGLVTGGEIGEEEGLMRLDADSFSELLFPQLDDAERKKGKVVAKGIGLCSKAAGGKLAFTAADLMHRVERGEKDVILVREEAGPDDVEGMRKAKGIIVAKGGRTSHAMVIGIGIGLPIIVVEDMEVNEEKGEMTVGGVKYWRDSEMTMDGSTGEIYEGRVKVVEAEVSGDFATVMGWTNKYKRMGVRANAETTSDAKKAREFGAEGIGLARTEHMFFKKDRIMKMREMIAAESADDREKALAKLLPFQRNDFEELLEANEGLPVTIRYLDPPLHEFLPKTATEMEQMAEEMGMKVARVRQMCAQMKEVNPMLGLRGCRLLLLYPEIAQMQTRAIMEAGADLLVKKPGFRWGGVEMLIPVVSHANEMGIIRGVVEETAQAVLRERGQTKERMPYRVGVELEVPSACLAAGKMAEHADFISFGTNDLTQTTLGYSRDDAKFIPHYVELGVYAEDPFRVLDEAVGEMVETAVKRCRARAGRANMECGICGEHGGEPRSIDFFHRIGMSYVSCSPFRVPVARLAAAQAAVRAKRTARAGIGTFTRKAHD
jgi:pyruvate,orthophosphate dikinase